MAELTSYSEGNVSVITSEVNIPPFVKGVILTLYDEVPPLIHTAVLLVIDIDVRVFTAGAVTVPSVLDS